MAVPTWSQQIDNMFTTTWAYRKPDVVEQMYLKTPFIFWLNQAGRVEKLRGYRRIEIPIEYGNNETVRWITKGSTVPIEEGELLTMAYEDWKYVSVTILRYGVEDQQNKGEARIIDYVKRKLNAAERALWEEFESALLASSVATEEMPNSLPVLVSTDPTTGVIHGLDRSTYTWWRNQATQYVGTSADFVANVRKMINDITKYARSEVRDIFMVTDQTSYEIFEDQMLDMKQFFNNALVDAGFEHLTYRGRPIMWMPQAPAQRMYFINPNYLKLVIDPDYFMEMTEWKPIPDQVNDKVAQIVCTLNLVCSRPVAQGVLYSIPTS